MGRSRRVALAEVTVAQPTISLAPLRPLPLFENGRWPELPGQASEAVARIAARSSASIFGTSTRGS